VFDDVVRVDPTRKYTLASRNRGVYFQGMYGQNEKIDPALLVVTRSEKDNNSTSPSTGQFKDFLFYKKIA
jgi:hypothetical protein